LRSLGVEEFRVEELRVEELRGGLELRSLGLVVLGFS